MEGDPYTPLQQQAALIDLVLYFRDRALPAIRKGADVQKIADLKVREKIGRAKEISFDDYEKVYADIKADVDAAITALEEEAERSDDL